VAIKFFTVLAEADDKLRDRLLEDFVLEGKLMSELSSRSAAIVQARDIGKLGLPDGSWMPYMVLEWIDGTPLDMVLSAERRAGMQARDLSRTMALLEPVAIALDVAHKQGVAHRDLKPANIMVLDDPASLQPTVKVLDFGIAKVMAGTEQLQQQLQATGQQVTAFTPNYGAPEQFSRNYGATGPWTDVYAMALILVEVLNSGQRALVGDSFFELGVASCDPNRRPTPAALGIAVPPGIDAVFAKALAIAPADRYPSMGELWRALHGVVHPGADTWRSQRTSPAIAGGSGPGASESLSPPMSTADGVAGARLMAQAPPASSSSSTGWLIGAALAVVAVAGAGGAFLAFERDDVASETAPDASATVAAATAAPSASASAAGGIIAWDGPCPKGMKPVSGGSFSMGSDDPSFKLWQPAHEVRLDTYCLDVSEVTVARYRDCVDAGNCEPADARPNFPKAKNGSDDDHSKQLDAFAEFCNWDKSGREQHPINCLSWSKANNYCKQQRFRLPTEAEWELAARGTDGRKFPWGDDTGDQTYMNAAGSEWREWLQLKELPEPNSLMYEASDGYAGTAPVGRFPRAQTQAGHLDMVGNVWEWTNDWYALYSADEQTNPKGPSAGDRKTIRGGGFNGEFAVWINPAARFHQLATASVHAVGFRCGSDIKPAD